MGTFSHFGNQALLTPDMGIRSEGCGVQAKQALLYLEKQRNCYTEAHVCTF